MCVHINEPPKWKNVRLFYQNRLLLLVQFLLLLLSRCHNYFGVCWWFHSSILYIHIYQTPSTENLMPFRWMFLVSSTQQWPHKIEYTTNNKKGVGIIFDAKNRKENSREIYRNHLKQNAKWKCVIFHSAFSLVLIYFIQKSVNEIPFHSCLRVVAKSKMKAKAKWKKKKQKTNNISMFIRLICCKATRRCWWSRDFVFIRIFEKFRQNPNAK